MEQVSEERAIPFIQYNKGIFSINPEAEEFVRQIPAPVGVIAVAGLYRTGKSYLLNRVILNQQSGFGVGPTINACTKGLWIWKKTISGMTTEGNSINIIVLDSEGLGALDEEANHDTKIFSLALLMSSFFIYNSVGSIDESALQNLSLVINLTKHIQLKTLKKNEEVDPEEYSNYFPSFMWVVRDFTLQLQDEEGSVMSSKEYLEKALTFQKGFSESCEQKNKIRKMLKAFFVDRDCCTMIRPLTNEENLQNLEKIEGSQLRPEFVEQAMELRRKVLNKMRTKMLNSNPLNGEMILNLAENYINAINKGVIPNIENAWTYVCKNECVKAVQESINIYNESMHDFAPKLPMDEIELLSIHKECKVNSVKHFNQKALGTFSKEYQEELIQKIKQKYRLIMEENQRESRKICLSFLSSSYSSIEKKLKSNEFDSFVSFEKELKAFQLYFLDQGPLGPDRTNILLEFCLKCCIEASDFFSKSIINESNIEKTVAQETINKLENELKELKEDSNKEKEQINSKIRVLENLRAELSAKEQTARENLTIVLKEKENIEKELKNKNDQEKKEFHRMKNDIDEKLNQKEEQLRMEETKVFTAQSEFDKQKALLQQKIVFLESLVEENKAKEKAHIDELRSLKKESSNMAKESSSKLESIIKEMNIKMNELNEKLSEEEKESILLKESLESERIKYASEEGKNAMKIKELTNMINDLRSSIQTNNKKSKAEFLIMQNKYDSEDQKYKDKIIELESKITNLEENKKVDKTKYEKDIAILHQQNQFNELQLKEVRIQLEEAQKTHESLVRTLDSKSDNQEKEEITLQAEYLREEHIKEIKELESNYEIAKNRLISQVEQLSEKLSDTEMKLKLSVNEYEKTIEQLNGEIQDKDKFLQSLQLDLKSCDENKKKLLNEMELKFKEQIRLLEKQIEDKEQNTQNEMEEIQKRTEESLAQMKNFYEMDKERLEHKINEERSKIEKRYTSQIDEYEQKIKEEQQQHAEEMEEIQSALRECEIKHQTIIMSLEQEKKLDTQKIQTFEENLKEAKESITKLNLINSGNLERQSTNFNHERNTLIEKNEKMLQELTNKERIIMNLENKIFNLQEEVKKRNESIDEFKNESSSEKSGLIEKIEILKSKNQQITEESMQKKVDYSKETALLKQQNQFSTNKISDLQKQLEETILNYEEKIKCLKDETKERIKDSINQLIIEKEQLEQKFETKKKLLKELQTGLSKQNLQFEQEKIDLAHKIELLIIQKSEQENIHNNDLGTLQAQIQQLKESNIHSDPVLIEENDKLNKQVIDMEREYSDLNSNYDRDKALWSGKFEFLEQQRDQAKSDLIETTKKFELTLEQLQKKGTMDKTRNEQSQQLFVNAIEQRYKSQIKELNDTHQQLTNELNQKIKTLEKNLKLVNEKIQQDQKGKIYEQGSIEKKLTELLDNNAKLLKEIEEVKIDRERKCNELQKGFDKEKEVIKARLSEAETKCKDSDAKRNVLVFELEKEKAKWSLEREHLTTQKNNLQEHINTLEKKKESLLMENEKIKADFKGNRKQMFGGVANSTVFSSTRYNSLYSKLKENQPDIKFIGSGEERNLNDGTNSSIKSSNIGSKLNKKSLASEESQ